MTGLQNWAQFVQKEARQLKVWIVHTQFDGDLNTMRGIADQLTQDIHYLQPKKALEDVYKARPELISQGLIGQHHAEWPDLVLCRTREIPIASTIKELSGGKTMTVGLRSPVSGSIKGSAKQVAETDMIVTYPHLREHGEQLPNMVTHATLPHRVSAKSIQAGQAEWRDEFSELTRRDGPVVALMVGGDIGSRRVFEPRHAERLGRQMNQIIKSMDGSAIVTTSRRTSPAAAEALMGQISDVPAYFHMYHHGKSQNPYFGLLGLADHLVVTADSMSMCCEAVSTGKPVHLFLQKNLLEPSHIRVAESLTKQGLARKLHGIAPLEHYTYRPVNATLEIAEDIRARLQQQGQGVKRVG